MEIDLESLQAEIGQLSPEELKQQLFDAKVRQKVATKKYYNADSAKKARDKRSAKLKQMAEVAKQTPATKPGFANLFEQINAEASEAAAEKLGTQEADEQETAA